MPVSNLTLRIKSAIAKRRSVLSYAAMCTCMLKNDYTDIEDDVYFIALLNALPEAFLYTVKH